MKRVLTAILASAILALLALMAPACQLEYGPGGHGFIFSEGVLQAADVDGQWSYISLREGRQIGVCSLSDSLGQAEWAARDDWDIALCNGHIRTNGGLSGIGEGGISFTEKDYEKVKASSGRTYAADSTLMEVW